MNAASGAARLATFTIVAALVLCPATACAAGHTTNVSNRLARIRALVFPKSVLTEADTRACEFVRTGYAFKSLSEVNNYNIRAQDAIPETSHLVQLSRSPMESPFHTKIREDSGIDELLGGLDAILEESSAPTRHHTARTKDAVIAKALAQRDLYQTFLLVSEARKRARDSRQTTADRILARLGDEIRATLLDRHEYSRLITARPRSLPGEYTSELKFSLGDNYLPQVVLEPDPTWLSISNRGEPFRHFVRFRGRSFVKVYMHASDATPAQLQALRQSTFDKYGTHLHITASSAPLPKDMQAVLVRTMGVMLTDGTWRDSFWPEEVIIRAFKYPQATLDLSTSDFVGTLFYQYRMSREKLLTDRKSLGLVRVRDDDRQFFGFFGDTPDLRNSYSATTTTMRENCISCHAELFYGTSTIFSFERDPKDEMQRDENPIWSEIGHGVYALRTEEFLALQEYLNATP